jgi:hypothetical protein
MTVSLQRSLHDARSFSQLVRSEVLTVVMMIMIMCCVVTPSRLVGRHQRLGKVRPQVFMATSMKMTVF